MISPSRRTLRPAVVGIAVVALTAAESLTVDPLPFRGMGAYPPTRPGRDTDARFGYRLDYNSRFVSSPAPRSYRLRYRGAR